MTGTRGESASRVRIDCIESRLEELTLKVVEVHEFAAMLESTQARNRDLRDLVGHLEAEVDQLRSERQVWLDMAQLSHDRAALMDQYRRSSMLYWAHLLLGRSGAPRRIEQAKSYPRRLVRPALGHLDGHPPRDIDIPPRYFKTPKRTSWPSISIATPSYNQAEFIEETIASVLNQGYPALEYVIQDGLSSDDTMERVKKFAQPGFRAVSQADAGQAQAINLGFAGSTGEIMAYLNSDDLLLPGSLHYIGDYFAAHPEVDVVYGHRVLINGDSQEINRWVMPRHRDEMLDWADYIPQETMFWRRSLWESVGGIDESFRFAMDWDLLVRFRDAGATMVRLPRFLGAFRIHHQQKTSAAIGEIGAIEMDRIRRRVHGRAVPAEEIHRELSPYMREHVLLQKAYRSGVLRH